MWYRTGEGASKASRNRGGGLVFSEHRWVQDPSLGDAQVANGQVLPESRATVPAAQGNRFTAAVQEVALSLTASPFLPLFNK